MRCFSLRYFDNKILYYYDIGNAFIFDWKNLFSNLVSTLVLNFADFASSRANYKTRKQQALVFPSREKFNTPAVIG